MDKDKFLYAPVSVPNWPQIHKEMLAYQQEIGTPPEWFFHNVEHHGAPEAMPTLMEWFESQGMAITECVYIIVRPRVTTNVHADLFAANRLALNFPVVGCETVRTHFYEELTEVIKNRDRALRRMMFEGINLGPVDRMRAERDPKKQNPHPEYKPDEVRSIDSTIVSVPTLLNVSILHAVVNKTNHPRIVFSYRFKEEPWHLVENVGNAVPINVEQ